MSAGQRHEHAPSPPSRRTHVTVAAIADALASPTPATTRVECLPPPRVAPALHPALRAVPRCQDSPQIRSQRLERIPPLILQVISRVTTRQERRREQGHHGSAARSDPLPACRSPQRAAPRWPCRAPSVLYAVTPRLVGRHARDRRVRTAAVMVYNNKRLHTGRGSTTRRLPPQAHVRLSETST